MPTPKLGRLLIVDDEVELMTALCEMLGKQGYEAEGFASGPAALDALRAREFDLLLADLMMPEMDGIALLRATLAIDSHLVGIIMTGHGTVPTAVEAMQVGAFDYVLKPFKLAAVLPVLARALDVRRLRLDNVQLRETLAIHELSKAIAFTLDANIILQKVADAALQQCEADEVSIMLPTGENDGLYVAVVRGQGRERLLGERMPMEQGIAGWVARHREAITLEGEIHDPRFAPAWPRPDIHSAISMPMLVGNHLVGVLNVNVTARRRPLTLGQIKALTILIGMAAPALEAARLHEHVRQSEENHRLALENVDEVVYRVETTGDNPLQGIVRFVSRRVENILGYRAEEFLDDPSLWASLLHPDDGPAVEARTRAIYASHHAGTREYRLGHKTTGEYRWMEDRVVPQFDEDVNLIGTFGVARDITERRQAEAERERLFEQVRSGRERLQSLSQQLLDVQEAERRRIALELHDEIGQTLTGLRLSLEMPARLPVEAATARLAQARTMVDELLRYVENLALDLRPAMLDDLGLLSALLWHIERYSARTGVPVNCKHTGLDRRFPPEIETAAFRIVQEALTNTARHAGVNDVTVRLWATPEILGLQVEDGGSGFDPEAALSAGATSGLSGMRERALLAGGHFEIESEPGNGARLTVELPLGIRLEKSEYPR